MAGITIIKSGREPLDGAWMASRLEHRDVSPGAATITKLFYEQCPGGLSKVVIPSGTTFFRLLGAVTGEYIGSDGLSAIIPIDLDWYPLRLPSYASLPPRPESEIPDVGEDPPDDTEEQIEWDEKYDKMYLDYTESFRDGSAFIFWEKSLGVIGTNSLEYQVGVLYETIENLEKNPAGALLTDPTFRIYEDLLPDSKYRLPPNEKELRRRFRMIFSEEALA